MHARAPLRCGSCVQTRTHTHVSVPHALTAGGCPREAPRPLGTGTKMRLREGRRRPSHESRPWRLTPLPASPRGRRSPWICDPNHDPNRSRRPPARGSSASSIARTAPAHCRGAGRGCRVHAHPWPLFPKFDTDYSTRVHRPWKHGHRQKAEACPRRMWAYCPSALGRHRGVSVSSHSRRRLCAHSDSTGALTTHPADDS